MFDIIKKWFSKEKQEPIKQELPITRPPKGWYVEEAGQNPMFMLWYIVLVNFDDVCNNVEKPRIVVAEEHDSFESAMYEAKHKVERKEYE
jgi:hypothetical protein